MLSRRGIPSHSHRGNHGGWKRATDRYPPAALGIRYSGGTDKKVALVSSVGCVPVLGAEMSEDTRYFRSNAKMVKFALGRET